MRRLGSDSINIKNNALLACSLAVLLILITYSAYGISAKPISPTFYQNASEHYANGTFSINWTGNASGDSISNYSIYVFNDSVLVMRLDNTSANGTLFSVPVNNGNYTFSISAVNASGDESENATSTCIFADLQAASITHNSPADGLNTSNATVYFNFSASDNTALNCSLYIDGALRNTNSTMANNTETILNATLAEGRHLWNVSCTDRANNRNTSAAYNIGIDLNAPDIALNSPSNGSWDPDGKINFTFTATDAVTAISNCSLWINAAANTAGAWHQDMGDNSVLSGTESAFAFDNGTNILGNGTYLWNVLCYDNVSNSGFASQNYTFDIGNATDFTVTGVLLINSSALQWNNPVPGSSLIINATIANTGTLNATSDMAVALFLESALLSNYTISNSTLTSNSSTNITFNISGGNITGYGLHNIKVAADYKNSIAEANENNNNRTLILLSGLNVSANITLGSAVQTPRPGENISINLEVKYQNGSAVTDLVRENFTIYDVYTYDNGTKVETRNLTINYNDTSQNANGIYLLNATAPVKTSANRAEYGRHEIRAYVKSNKSAVYYGEDNQTSNYYNMRAPNLELQFNPSDAYHLDLSGHTIESFTLRIKNNGTANITGIIISISTNGSATLTNNSINYSSGAICNLENITISNIFSAIPSCSIIFNATIHGGYTLAAIAGGMDSANSPYNSTRITRLMLVDNTTAAPSTSSSSNGAAVIATYTYAINITNYTKLISLEQGERKNTAFSIKNIGNGTISNISVNLINTDIASWGNWHNSTKISRLSPKETASVRTSISVPLNAIVATYAITVNAAGKETGSSKTATFLIQVLPGNDTKKEITVSLTEINAQIAELNDTISKLLQNTNNINLIIASKKLSEIIRLQAEAEQAILKGDYLTAYNNKKDIEAMLPEIRELLVIEKQAIEKKQNTQIHILIIVAFLLAVAGAFYYLWLPEEGYVPGKGYFKKNSTPYITRLKDIFYELVHKSARTPYDTVKDMMDKDKQNTKLLKTKDQPYAYSSNSRSSAFRIDKLSQNIIDQFKEHGKTREKPNYNFHKKQRWSYD